MWHGKGRGFSSNLQLFPFPRQERSLKQFCLWCTAGWQEWTLDTVRCFSCSISGRGEGSSATLEAHTVDEKNWLQVVLCPLCHARKALPANLYSQKSLKSFLFCIYFFGFSIMSIILLAFRKPEMQLETPKDINRYCPLTNILQTQKAFILGLLTLIL